MLLGLALGGCSARYEEAMRRDLRAASEGLAPSSSEGAGGERPADRERPGAPPTGEGLAAYVGHALRAHPQLRADYERWRAAVHRISEARRLPEPTLSYGVFVQSVETRVGPQRHRLSFQQPFPWPTLLTAGADAHAARARALQRAFEARATALRAAVEERYWALWSLRELRAIEEEQAQILQGLAEVVRGRLEAGQATFAELQQIEVSRARLADRIRSLGEMEQAAEAALVEAVAAPPGSPLPTAGEGPTLRLPAEPEEALRVAAFAHPRIEAHALLAEASEHDAERADAMRLPSFTLGVDWIETGEAMMPGVQGSGTDPVVLGLGVRLPVWQGSYEESRRAALAEGAAHRADREAAENAAAAALRGALIRIRDSGRRAAFHRDTLLPQALSSYESTLGAYAVGRGSVAALLLAQRALIELREGELEARTRHAQAWAALLDLVGREVEAAAMPTEGSSATAAGAESPSDPDPSDPDPSDPGPEGGAP